MIKKLLFFTALFISGFIHSQIRHEMFDSPILEQRRELKIQLPRNYEQNTHKTYPIIVVLDGDYLFEPMAGNVDYYSYWDIIPEAIVVGINQYNTRGNDTYYDEQRYLPSDSGADFFEFLGMELLKFMDDNYRTSKFAVLTGHDLTANFINYYLLKEEPLFHAYINLSPDLAPEMQSRLVKKTESLDRRTWFYLATSTEDIPDLRKASEELDQQLSLIDNKNFKYSFHHFDNATHYSLVGKAIPAALEEIFSSFAPITTEDYDSEIVNSGISPYDYLLNKYETIETNYGVDLNIRLNDMLAVGKALEFNQMWTDLEKLGKLALEHHPKTMLGTYYLARSYEENGNPKKAMRTYQNAYGQQEVAFLTMDFMLKQAEAIKRDFGY